MRATLNYVQRTYPKCLYGSWTWKMISKRLYLMKYWCVIFVHFKFLWPCNALLLLLYFGTKPVLGAKHVKMSVTSIFQFEHPCLRSETNSWFMAGCIIHVCTCTCSMFSTCTCGIQCILPMGIAIYMYMCWNFTFMYNTYMSNTCTCIYIQVMHALFLGQLNRTANIPSKLCAKCTCVQLTLII